MEGDADMIKWLKSRFSVPEDGTVSEKVFLSRITLNITVIIICMIAMALTAFAYFSVDISSQNNKIQAAHFDVEISVCSEIGDFTVSEPIDRQNTDVYVVNLKANTVYAVEVTAIGNASTGFVVVSAGGYQYHTEQLLLDDKMSIVFYVRPTQDMTVTLMPHWGTSSHYALNSAGESDAFYFRDDPDGLEIRDIPVYVP